MFSYCFTSAVGIKLIKLPQKNYFSQSVICHAIWHFADNTLEDRNAETETRIVVGNLNLLDV